jgi:biopolymer transport protein ExbD
MTFGIQDGNFADSGHEVMSEINMTPLADVMLVLLIVFIITVPVMKHAGLRKIEFVTDPGALAL